MNDFSTKKIRLLFILFFLALATPSSILSFKAFEQLRWQALHQYQLDAQVLVQQIDSALSLAINKEEARSDTEYTFFVLAGNAEARFVQRSELSKFPVKSDLAGVIGYFQIDEKGDFSSPVLPSEYVQSAAYPKLYGISVEENRQRKKLLESIKNILIKNELVKNELVQDERIENKNNSLNEEMLDEGFDKLITNDAIEKEEKLFNQLAKKEKQQLLLVQKKQKSKRKSLNVASSQQRKNRIEKNYSPQQSLTTKSDVVLRVKQDEIKIKLFESEIEPFKFSLLSSGHFVVYRQVLRNDKRVIQGAVLSSQDFLSSSINHLFEQSPLFNVASLSVLYHDNEIKNYPLASQYDNKYDSSRQFVSTNSGLLNETQLLPISLNEPFASFALNFKIQKIKELTGSSFIKLISFCLMLILILGTYLLYRLAIKQNRLTLQQQNFVSSVSHELKTPLTSIRMYGEILKQGWANDEKKQEYYDYIFTESERLSRLISNILQISKVSHNALDLNLQEVSILELRSLISSKVDSQITQSKFKMNLVVEPPLKSASLFVDSDAFVQIAINLVDNAIKYAAKSEIKEIDVKFGLSAKQSTYFSVRDYGPGINREQLKTVFELFYRSGNELTREAKGTGIGLALVKELTKAMSAKIEAINHNQGVELRVTF
jgi:signal transduction histidine kinase